MKVRFFAFLIVFAAPLAAMDDQPKRGGGRWPNSRLRQAPAAAPGATQAAASPMLSVGASSTPPAAAAAPSAFRRVRFAEGSAGGGEKSVPTLPVQEHKKKQKPKARAGASSSQAVGSFVPEQVAEGVAPEEACFALLARYGIVEKQGQVMLVEDCGFGRNQFYEPSFLHDAAAIAWHNEERAEEYLISVFRWLQRWGFPLVSLERYFINRHDTQGVAPIFYSISLGNIPMTKALLAWQAKLELGMKAFGNSCGWALYQAVRGLEMGDNKIRRARMVEFLLTTFGVEGWICEGEDVYQICHGDIEHLLGVEKLAQIDPVGALSTEVSQLSLSSGPAGAADAGKEEDADSWSSVSELEEEDADEEA